MKKLAFSLGLFGSLLISYSLQAQVNEDYKKNVAIADSLYDVKNYSESVIHYTKAFESIEGKAYPADRYNAACTFSLAGDVEKAYYHLFRLANDSKYDNYNHMIVDGDLKNLYDDQRWEELKELVLANKKENEKDLDQELVAVLDEVYISDQGSRMGIRDSIAKYGNGSEEIKAVWNNMRKVDSINTIIVSKIIDERGWLGPKVIGKKGSLTLFLVIQHAPIEVQEKYIPLLREAVEKKEANASNLALMEDRVALRQGKNQIYGSQIGSMPGEDQSYVLPLMDPDNVDARRASVGLGSLSEYTRRFGITWDLEAYKKMLPELEAKYKKNK